MSSVKDLASQATSLVDEIKDGLLGILSGQSAKASL